MCLSSGLYVQKKEISSTVYTILKLSLIYMARILSNLKLQPAWSVILLSP